MKISPKNILLEEGVLMNNQTPNLQKGYYWLLSAFWASLLLCLLHSSIHLSRRKQSWSGEVGILISSILDAINISPTMFESDLSIQPSHLFYCLTIYYMIHSVRDESASQILRSHVLKLLDFLSDNIDIKTITILGSLEHFRTIAIDYIDDIVVIESICDNCLEVQTIDHLMDFMEKLKTIFEIDPSTSSDSLYGPNKITVTSSLGIFVRRVSSFWECMPFEAHCTIMKDFVVFCKETNFVPSRTAPHNSTSSELDFISLYDDSSDLTLETKDFTEDTETFLLDNNISSAENRVHDYFDTLAHDPLSIRYRGQDIKSLDVLVQELSLIEAGRSSSLPKHQFAMMTLALTWISAGNFALAQSAIEEALKSSHQRGDHPSVVKSLLILFHIMEKSNHFDAIRGEELLHRCIVKSGLLGLNELTTEALLSFAKLKTAQFYSFSNDADSPIQNIFDSESPLDWSFEELWNLLAFGLHGESSLTVQYCTKRYPGSIDDVAAPTGQGVIPQQGKVVTELFSPINDKYAEFTFRSYILYAELWSRIHQYETAVLYCNRAINLFADNVKSQSFVLLMSKLIFNQLNCIFQTFAGQRRGDKVDNFQLMVALNTIYQHYHKLQSHFQKTFRVATSLNRVRNCFRVLHDYLSIFLCINAGEYSRSYRFAETMVDALGFRSGADDTMFQEEDRVRCIATKIVVSGLVSGERKSIIHNRVQQVCRDQERVFSHISSEPCFKWLISKSES